MERITLILRRYINRDPRKDSGFVQLFISKRLLHGAAGALLGIFLPIYLYTQTGESFWVVGGFYAASSLLYLLLLPPAMRITNWLGFSRTLILGGIFSILFYLTLYFVEPAQLLWWIGPLIIILTCFRLFHWVPFHVDFTMFTKPGERGRDVSLTFATIAFLGVIGPILAGFIVEQTSYQILFLIAIVLLVAATISYGLVPETAANYEWGVGETWRKLFSPEMRGIASGAFANGAEVVVTLVAWPIFLYEILDGDLFDIGAISTVIVALTIGVQILIGRYIDRAKGNSVKTLRVGSMFYAIGWVLKIFVLSAAQVFFVGLYHNVTKIFTKTPFSALMYDMSGEQSRYVDEITVVKEMSEHAGRTLSLVAIIIVSFIFPINYTFIIAAVASLALNMIHRFQHN